MINYSYCNVITVKVADQTLDDVTKATKRQGIGKSTVLREILTRYLPHYLASLDNAKGIQATKRNRLQQAITAKAAKNSQRKVG